MKFTNLLSSLAVAAFALAAPITLLAQTPGSGPAAPSAPLKLSLAKVLLEQKVKFKNVSGAQIHEFKPKGDDAVKFYNAAGAELCKLTVSPEKLKAKTEDDRPLFELKWRSDRAIITDAAGNKELFRLKPKGDGFDFYSGEKLTAVIRKNSQGYAIHDAADKPLASVSSSSIGSELHDARGNVLFACKELTHPLGLTPWALPGLTPEQKSGLIVYLLCLQSGK